MAREVSSRSVYVIGVAESPVKIGIAHTPTKRLIELQVGCPDKLVIHHAVRVPFELAERIEREAHAKLAEHHRHGEWFNVHADVALETVQTIKDGILAHHRRVMNDGGDLIERLSASYELRRDAREAVLDYRDRMDDKQTEYVGHANGYILKDVGTLAYAAFSLVIAQRTPMSTLKGEDRDRADLALVKAINALATFRELHQRAVRAKMTKQFQNGDYSALQRMRAA